MKVRLTIHENDQCWSGEMIGENSAGEPVLCYAQAKPGARLKSSQWERFPTIMLLSAESRLTDSELKEAQASHQERLGDPHGCKAATLDNSKQLHPLTFKMADTLSHPQTPDEFKLGFMRLCQAVACDHARQTGQVIAPVNYVEDFWTPEHVRTLALRLKKPAKERVLRLREYLLLFWEKRGLCEMDATELAAHVNKKLTINLKARTVWKFAYRSGLFSDRKQGPKGG